MENGWQDKSTVKKGLGNTVAQKMNVRKQYLTAIGKANMVFMYIVRNVYKQHSV